MIETENIVSKPFPIIQHFPFDVLKMAGAESVDFLQRISTNDFSNFTRGKIQKTLLVTDKGRILDTLWVIHRSDDLLLLVSSQMSSEVMSFLNTYIIMEDILITDVTSEYDIHLHFENNANFFQTDYFGLPVSFEIQQSEELPKSLSHFPPEFEAWRIENGIPITKKEIVQDFNPLELNLWNWISFTKGCYIGQEVIARLDTYDKVQRLLCTIFSTTEIQHQEILTDESGIEIGKLTSILKTDSGFIGLALIKVKFAVEQQQVKSKTSSAAITVTKVFTKERYGRN